MTEKKVSSQNENNELVAASQWKLMGWRFRRHRLAMGGLTVLAIAYLCALLCEFVAPYQPDYRDKDYVMGPPQGIHFIDEAGNFHLRPFVYGVKLKENGGKWSREYVRDTSEKHPVRFFAKGQEYKMWNLFKSSLHLFAAEGGNIHLFGTDSLGRDIFSRSIYGARISLTIGLVGVGLSFIIGITLGGIAGYFGGIADHVVQRSVEILMCIPQLPLWMGLSAALPAYWPPVKMYFGITVILSIFGWTGMARVVRGKFLSLRDEDFVVAARLCGTGSRKIIFRHLLPSFLSHIITAGTLAIPSMILGETALSFLGIGLRPPAVSWGVLLQDAQNFQAVAMVPWLLLPALLVVITVLAFNVVGDGLRDAADPYSSL